MRHKQIAEIPKTFILIFETGDELLAGLKQFAVESPLHLQKRIDPDSGLALINL
jgi:hypothetical protein